MAPKIKFSYDDVLTAAMDILREKGIDAVNARSVAARLKSSIQPVFRTFGTMDELKNAIYNKSYEIYHEQMYGALNSGKGLIEIALAYMRFARTEKNLFKFMYMTNKIDGGKLTELPGDTPGDNASVALICDDTGLDAEKARELYRIMWFTVHGIASLLASNSCTISDDEARNILTNTYKGLQHTQS